MYTENNFERDGRWITRVFWLELSEIHYGTCGQTCSYGEDYTAWPVAAGDANESTEWLYNDVPLLNVSKYG